MTTTDERGFIDAIVDDPNCDTTRLVYADWLDENAGTVACPRCEGGQRFIKGGYPLLDPNNLPAPLVPKDICFACHGKYYLPDDRADRAELIRVQVELARVHCPRHFGGRNPLGPCGDDSCRSCPLVARESALVRTHHEWRPICLRCDGEGEICTSHRADCYHCSGTGRIGTFTRGLLESVTVPTLETVLRHEFIRCENPVHFDNPKRPGWKQRRNCETCGGTGQIWDWLPTPWASSLVRDRERWPALREVRIGDRETTTWSDVPAMFERAMEDVPSFENGAASYICGEQSRIPGFVFDEMVKHCIANSIGSDGGYYFVVGKHSGWRFNTPELANAALGQAVWRVLLRLYENHG